VADDLEEMLLFTNYIDSDKRAAREVLPRSNPFDEYDDKKFRQRFRFSKNAIIKILEQVTTIDYDTIIYGRNVHTVNTHITTNGAH